MSKEGRCSLFPAGYPQLCQRPSAPIAAPLSSRLGSAVPRSPDPLQPCSSRSSPCACRELLIAPIQVCTMCRLLSMQASAGDQAQSWLRWDGCMTKHFFLSGGWGEEGAFNRKILAFSFPIFYPLKYEVVMMRLSSEPFWLSWATCYSKAAW